MMELKDGEYIVNTKEVLGSGNYGYVFKCQHTKTKEKLVAKIIKKEKLKNLGKYAKTLLKREIEIHKKVSESGIPYFVHLNEAFYEQKNLILIMERCDYDLEKLLKKNISVSLATQLTFQIAVGILFLHNMEIIHRDIKPSNIMVKSNTIKIGDFGFATRDKLAETNLGSLPYQAPEIFVADEGKGYDNKVDVWALNTIFYKLLTKEFFYKPCSDRDYFYQQLMTKKFIFPKKFEIDDQIKDLITQGYSIDPRKRPDILQYIYHPLFQALREEYSFIVHKSQNSKINNVQKDTQKNIDDWFHKMECFIKVNKLYFELAKNLKNVENQSVLRALLMKKALQMLALIYLKVIQKEQIAFLTFIETEEEWTQFLKHKKLPVIIKTIKELVKKERSDFLALQDIIKKEFSNKKNEVFKRNLSSLFDLNQAIDLRTFNYYLDKELAQASSPLSEQLSQIKRWENNEDKTFYFNQSQFQ